MITLLSFGIFSLVAGGMYYLVEDWIWRSRQPDLQPLRVRSDEHILRRTRRSR